MEVMDQYAVVYYYAILLLIGSEIYPQNQVQTIFSAFVVIFGSILIAFIFGNMAALMASVNKKDTSI